MTRQVRDNYLPPDREAFAAAEPSTGRVIVPPDLQQRMLVSEGVVFNEKGRCDLGRYRWTPEEYAGEEDGGDAEQPSLFGD